MARPASYDTERVLESALTQFWSSGFNGSSVDDLVDGTALNKHSLYQAFGGKKGLFLQAIERFLHKHSRHYLALLDDGAGMRALENYFSEVLRHTDERGCLLVNTAVELGAADPAIHKVITRYYQRLAKGFCGALQRGQADGSIRADLDPVSTADWLLHATQGLSVNARLQTRSRCQPDSLLGLLGTAGPEAALANRRHS